MAGRINTLILKVAERCNINCSYCYMYQHEDRSFERRPVFMSDEIFDQVLNRMREYCLQRKDHKMGICFHGGEPTLVGVTRFDQLVSRAREVLGDQLALVKIQTNAILVDNRWVDLFARHKIRVGVSLDGPADVHDAHRVDHSGTGSHEATLKGLRMLQASGLSPGVLCVISPAVSGLRVYRYFRSIGIERMNFLIPDISHDNKARLYGQYGETPIADYLIPIFDEWFNEDNPQIYITVFWELISAMLGGAAVNEAFGNPLIDYLVIETDGSIQANDVLRVCQDGIVETGLNVFEHGFDDLPIGSLLYRTVHERIPLAQKCQFCPEQVVCGGGNLPHRYSRANSFNNPSVWCGDILLLLAHIRNRTALVNSNRNVFPPFSS